MTSVPSVNHRHTPTRNALQQNRPPASVINDTRLTGWISQLTCLRNHRHTPTRNADQQNRPPASVINDTRLTGWISQNPLSRGCPNQRESKVYQTNSIQPAQATLKFNKLIHHNSSLLILKLNKISSGAEF